MNLYGMPDNSSTNRTDFGGLFEQDASHGSIKCKKTDDCISEVKMKKILIPYGRPSLLTDPYRDFSPDILQGIIDTPDQQLGFYEFCCIFQSVLPAGSYEESSYFIPFLLDYFDNNLKNNTNEAELITLIENFIIWCEQNIKVLTADGITNGIRQAMTQWFCLVTNEFIVESSGHLRHGCFIDDLLLNLYKSDTFSELAKKMLLYLKNNSRCEHLEWIIYCYGSLVEARPFFEELLSVNFLEHAYEKVLYKISHLEDEVLIDFWDNQLKYYPII